ncbi:hypothetical protein [Lentzea sp. NPDC004782]|uniref:GNAT family N-acetyltransferase n=1 Tax=Lentzea sp. NPDC004782 TaxID=3154458 RepID=UPI0033B69C9A
MINRGAWLAAHGFSVTRDGRRFVWQNSGPLPVQDDRLRWWSLAELGEEPFVDLLADMLELGHERNWYEIGYDRQDRPVAISLPARTPSSAVIGLVGVATTGRGRGYATAVVARGTYVLVTAGATEIRGDCDAGNIGMVKAFQRAGYHNFANRKMFSRPLQILSTGPAGRHRSAPNSSPLRVGLETGPRSASFPRAP